MEFDQNDPAVIAVLEGMNGQWDVNETGFEQSPDSAESGGTAIEPTDEVGSSAKKR